MPTIYPSLPVTRTPIVPSPYGLFSVATEANDFSDAHAQLGIEVQPLDSAPAKTTTTDCPPYYVVNIGAEGDTPEGIQAGPGIKTPTNGIPSTTTRPLTVYAALNCGPVGTPWDEVKSRATEMLMLGEARAVETELELGTNGAWPSLITTPTVLHGGTSVDPVRALSLLEKALGANYGGRGIIHVPRDGATYLAYGNDVLATDDNGRLRTRLGTWIAAGGGYAGTTAPTGQTTVTDSEWWYATGMVTIRRSPIFVVPDNQGQSIDRTINSQTVYAERTYEVTWDAPVAAISPPQVFPSVTPIAYAVRVQLGVTVT